MDSSVDPESCEECGRALSEGSDVCPACAPTTARPAREKSGWDALKERVAEATGEKYRIVGLLGFGGMAGVYLADEPRLGRQVAIKVIKPGLMMDPDLIDRFHNEARTIARLNHPNIVTVYDIGGAGDVHYFTMTYVPGPTDEEGPCQQMVQALL